MPRASCLTRKLWDFLRSWPRRSHTRTRRERTRPQVEPLEDRLTPDVSLVAGPPVQQVYVNQDAVIVVPSVSFLPADSTPGNDFDALVASGAGSSGSYQSSYYEAPAYATFVYSTPGTYTVSVTAGSMRYDEYDNLIDNSPLRGISP